MSVVGRFLSVLGVGKKPSPVSVSDLPTLAPADPVAVSAEPQAASTTELPPRLSAVIPGRRLRPRDASVQSFVNWMIETGATGQWQFSDLWDLYGEAWIDLGWDTVPLQVFRVELNAAGLAKGQLDLRRNGRRYRPTYFVIPSRSEFDARQKMKARLFEGRALCA